MARATRSPERTTDSTALSAAAPMGTWPPSSAFFTGPEPLTEKRQPDASLSTWMEMYAPARTPKPIVDRLSAALDKTMKDPDVIAAIEKAGLSVEYHDAAATLTLVERENEVVTRLAKKLNPGR